VTTHAPDPAQTLDAILMCLVANMTVAVSGERLARELGISHSRLLRSVNKLREVGVEIQGEPFSGFRLPRLPDVLLPGLITPRLHSGRIGRTIHHLYEVDSTNGYALDLRMGGEAGHGTVVIAEGQRAGRGRRGRAWVSEPCAGLYISLVLEPDISCPLAPLLTLGAAVAAHDAVEHVTRLAVDVKWPNDLLVGRKKICGVLSELQAELDQVSSMVVGVGINVNQDQFPKELEDRASSLRNETGVSQSRVELLLEFLARFERLYESFLALGPEAIIARWIEESSFAFGRTIEVHDLVRRVRGVTEGLNALGALRVRQDDGTVQEVYSGDVLFWE
jgi:BirA family transcriptional regulator, biotin operon repressor / biotin---[acetyl-CoA-carboxylase] ligase